MDKERFYGSNRLPIFFGNDGCSRIPMALRIRGPDPGVVSCPVRMLSPLQTFAGRNMVCAKIEHCDRQGRIRQRVNTNMTHLMISRSHTRYCQRQPWRTGLAPDD